MMKISEEKNSYSLKTMLIFSLQDPNYVDRLIRINNLYSLYTFYSYQLAFFPLKIGFAFNTNLAFEMHTYKQVHFVEEEKLNENCMFILKDYLEQKFLYEPFFLMYYPYLNYEYFLVTRPLQMF